MAPPPKPPATVLRLDPKALHVKIPDPPEIHPSQDLRSVVIAVTDQVSALTIATRELADGQANLIGVVLSLQGLVERKQDEVVEAAVKVAIEEARRAAEDTARESVPDLVERFEDDKELAARRKRDEERKKLRDYATRMVISRIITVVVSLGVGGAIWEGLRHLFGH